MIELVKEAIVYEEGKASSSQQKIKFKKGAIGKWWERASQDE